MAAEIAGPRTVSTTKRFVVVNVRSIEQSAHDDRNDVKAHHGPNPRRLASTGIVALPKPLSESTFQCCCHATSAAVDKEKAAAV